MNRVVLLDNEAIQALTSPHHAKHRRTLAFVEATQARKRSGRSPTTTLVVPTSVRVEAGWDRTAPTAAFVNRLGIVDHPLDTGNANTAARLAARHAVSVADAHLGTAIRTYAGQADVTALTSDPSDIGTVGESSNPNVVAL